MVLLKLLAALAMACADNSTTQLGPTRLLLGRHLKVAFYSGELSDCIANAADPQGCDPNRVSCRPGWVVRLQSWCFCFRLCAYRILELVWSYTLVMP